MREVLRLFVALYPPMAWREAACAHASAMVQAGAMLTSAEQAHLTLVFIGETIKKRVHEVEVTCPPNPEPATMRVPRDPGGVQETLDEADKAFSGTGREQAA